MLTSDDYYTPAWVFEKLGVTFDMDVCAPKDGIPHIPTKQHFSIENDGLIQEWHGRIWMNPPYSKPKPWVEKFIEHGNGIALLPLTKSAWFVNAWNTMDGIVLLPSSLKFHREDKFAQIFAQTCLMAMGEDNVKAISNHGRVR